MNIKREIDIFDFHAADGVLSLMRKMLFFSLPIILLQMLSVAAGFFDAIWLSHFGAVTLAADGLSYRVYMVALIFSSGISLALGVRLAQVADNGAGLSSLFRQSLCLVALLAALGVFFLVVLAPYLFHVTGQNPLAIAKAKPFLIQLSLASVLMFFAGLLRQVLIILGRQRWLYGMAVLYLLVHMFLSYGFIFGRWGLPQLGLVGVGISEWVSVLATVVVTIMLLFSAWPDTRSDPFLQKRGLNFSSPGSLFSLWASSWPVAGLMVCEMFAITVMVMMLGHFGVGAIASYVMASQLDLLPLMIPFGLEIAIGILVSKKLAQGDRHAAAVLVRATLWLVMIPMGVFALLFWLFPSQLIQMVFHARLLARPHLLHLAATMLMVAAVYHLFYSARNIWVGALRGLGDVRVPLLITAVSFWVVGLGSAYVLSHTYLGAMGVWLGMALAMACSALGTGWRYRQLMRDEVYEGQLAAL